MSKTLAVIAAAIGVVAISTGSALAGSGCGSYTQTTQSVSVETPTGPVQTASSEQSLPQTPKPESTSSN